MLNTGAWHALGTQRETLATLRTLVNPGGRVLFAAEFWERPPTEAEIGRMWPDIKAEDTTDIAGLTDLAIEAGFRPLRIESVTRGEWRTSNRGSPRTGSSGCSTTPPTRERTKSARSSTRYELSGCVGTEIYSGSPT